MRIQALGLSLIPLLAVFGMGESVGDQKEVTIDAAYTTEYLLYLIVGNEVMFVNKEMNMEMIIIDTNKPASLARLPVQAAVSTFDKSVRDVYFYGPNRGLFVEFTNYDNVRDLIYDTEHPLFSNGGPDAAAKKGVDLYVFKGDHMAVRTGPDVFGDPVAMPEGMPRDLDAAWNDGDDMIVLKGDKIWTWMSDGTVSDSSNFNEKYDLSSWVLKPSD